MNNARTDVQQPTAMQPITSTLEAGPRTWVNQLPTITATPTRGSQHYNSPPSSTQAAHRPAFVPAPRLKRDLIAASLPNDGGCRPTRPAPCFQNDIRPLLECAMRQIQVSKYRSMSAARLWHQVNSVPVDAKLTKSFQFNASMMHSRSNQVGPHSQRRTLSECSSWRPPKSAGQNVSQPTTGQSD